jgi:hypothetical protein
MWSPAKASTWLKNYADSVAGDAYEDGGTEFLYAAAGAAYYAVISGVGYNSKEEFKDFIINHMKLNQDFFEEAVNEIGC